ncbi:MAG TPA: hypothetical protein VFF18_04140 [Woeseiaceae bacterium]|nr:hypothetical protein [Woeseiaceae bacterium]
MTRLGYLLLAAGFLSGAYFASTDADATEWAWFLPAAFAGAAGVIMVKRATRAGATADHVLEGNRRDLTESLTGICANLERLYGDRDSIPPHNMRFEIDRLFRDDLIRFVDARHSLSHLYGLQVYADVMSEFAAGERYLNRVWSASADNYVDEVMLYLGKARDQFLRAKKLLDSIVENNGAR